MNRQTQRFSGKTLETAVLGAINELGEDAEILDARRVRRGGVGGFFASEHYVVTARPSARSAAGGVRTSDAAMPGTAMPDAAVRAAAPAVAAAPVMTVGYDDAAPVGFEAHLRELVTAVETQGLVADRVRPAAVPRDPVPMPASAAHRVSPLPRFFSDEDLVPIGGGRPRPVQAPAFVSPFAEVVGMDDGWDVDDELEVDLREPVAVHTPAPRQRVAAGAARPAPVVETPTWQAWNPPSISSQAPPAPPAAQAAPATQTAPVIDLRGPDGPGWSHEALAALGVPEAVLTRIPEGLEGDMAWTAALEQAIREVVPPPPDPQQLGAALSVSGPAAAAPRLLQAALTGYPLGDLQLADRRVPATAFELTLAIRSCLRP
ncbi:MAG: hypothetical protein MUE34_01170 [Acidimicrobiales bacterium]|nr:hypothetical protein [Acidimicrobiales bacterium]